MDRGFISATSYVVEPTECYAERLDKKYRSLAPRIEQTSNGEDMVVIPGMDDPTPLSLLTHGRTAQFADVPSGGWNPKQRIADQEREGIAAEILFPTLALRLCQHSDGDYKRACFEAYNQWLQEYCSAAPGRLFGIGLTAVTSVDEAIQDVQQAKERGFVGILLPGFPQGEDYDDAAYTALWKCAADLGLPVHIHALGSPEHDLLRHRCSSNFYGTFNVSRNCQDVVALFVMSHAFEQVPSLKLITVQADASWMPHLSGRMMHYYEVHGFYLGAHNLEQPPSYYLRENVYMTLLDDWAAFGLKSELNMQRLLWGSHFPQGDSYWPESRETLEPGLSQLNEEEKSWFLRDNSVELYGLPLH